MSSFYEAKEKIELHNSYFRKLPKFLSVYLILNENDFKRYYRYEVCYEPLSYKEYLEKLSMLIPVNILLERGLITSKEYQKYNEISLQHSFLRVDDWVLREMLLINNDRVFKALKKVHRIFEE